MPPGDELEAARHAFERGNAPLDRVARDAEADRGGDNAQNVVDVRPAHERRPNRETPGRAVHVERQPLERRVNRRRADIGRVVDAECQDGRSAGGQLGAARIVNVDDGWRARWQHLEQPALGREVLLHVTVKIEMVAREVGENRRGEAEVRDAMQRERVRGDLDRARRAPAVDHLPKEPLDFCRLRRRVRRVSLV